MKKIFITSLLFIFSFASLSFIKPNVSVDNVSTKKYASQRWFDEKEGPTDYEYSFAVIGDTQVLAEKYPQEMHGIYDWLLENKDSKKIAHVFGLGDITETWVKVNMSEWNLAKAAISKLDGEIPHSLVRGNHDETDFFNQTFNYPEYTDQFDGFMVDGQLANSYKTLKVGETDYLFITLDYGAGDPVLEWASEIVEQHPYHKVIVTTHAYMNSDGTVLGEGDVNTPSDVTDIDNAPTRHYNTGTDIWDKFIKKHGNIILVLSGHCASETVYKLQSTGIHGNAVTQLLCDFQWVDKASPVGMVVMLYFNADGTKMDVEVFSTVRNQYFVDSNQYTVDLSYAGDCAHNFKKKQDSTHHWEECTDCDGYVDPEEHQWVSDNKGYLSCKCGLLIRDENYKPEKEGCSGSLTASIIGVSVITGVVVFLGRKKKEEE